MKVKCVQRIHHSIRARTICIVGWWITPAHLLLDICIRQSLLYFKVINLWWSAWLLLQLLYSWCCLWPAYRKKQTLWLKSEGEGPSERYWTEVKRQKQHFESVRYYQPTMTMEVCLRGISDVQNNMHPWICPQSWMFYINERIQLRRSYVYVCLMFHTHPYDIHQIHCFVC